MNELLKNLNQQQKQAVTTTFPYVLILAGAGSGKTFTITSRVIYLIRQLMVDPRQILAVTFTNKAANEMKERISQQLAEQDLPMIKTFHSFGAYILRRECLFAGRNHYFQIYDENDSNKLLSELIKKIGHEQSELKKIKKWIKAFKQNLENKQLMHSINDSYLEIYREYNEQLKAANCFDFEDLILQPIKIFEQYAEILKKYQNQYQYILIDEYQDTNFGQNHLLKLLNHENASIMVVGDEDQSIYRFRGADINIILNFQHEFKPAQIIKLEENYRSTANILNLANGVISNNKMRIGKNLYTTGDAGPLPLLFDVVDENYEAEKICSLIVDLQLEYDQTAILYRTNNQSRIFEQYFQKYSIPYMVYGSIGFFDREEIKDSLLILKWLINPRDKLAFTRFVNKPARGIGKKSLSHFLDAVADSENDVFQALSRVSEMKKIALRARQSLHKIYQIFKNKNELMEKKSASQLLEYYLKELNLIEFYENKDHENATDKILNLNEFIKSIEYIPPGTHYLASFLEEVSLSSTQLAEQEDQYTIKLMTIHNAKGLEFKNIFISGLEEGLFPHNNSLEEEQGIEEERRLFYVAITRAKKKLFLFYSYQRNIFGHFQYNRPSQFIYELDRRYLDLNYLQNQTLLKNFSGFYYHQAEQDNAADDLLQQGDLVQHKKYGQGKVTRIMKKSDKHIVQVDFWDYSLKEFILEITDLKKIEAD